MTGDDDGDPLDNLVDEVADERSVPPSEEVSAADEGEETGDEDGETDGDLDAEDVTAEIEGRDAESPPELEGERAGPLGDMAEEVERRHAEREAEPEDDLFESVDVGDVDSEALWEQVSTEESTAQPEAATSEVRVISKSKYCQRCEYFTDPPEVGCTHEGTTIRAEATMDEFEVVDCPKILEDERLERTR